MLENRIITTWKTCQVKRNERTCILGRKNSEGRDRKPAILENCHTGIKIDKITAQKQKAFQSK